MAKTDPALIPGAATGELAHGSLRLVDAIAISVSVIAPGMAMLLNVSGVALVSGGSTPLAFLLGGIACLALAFVVVGFTRRMAAAGYAYTYTSRSLGKERRLHGRLAVLLRLHLLRADDHVRGRLPRRRPAARQPEAVDPVLLHRDGAVPGAVHDQDQGHHPGAAHRRHRHGGDHPDRRRGHHGQGRRQRAGAVGVQLQPLPQGRLQRRVLRDHPRRHVLHRLRDRGRLRRGDREPAAQHPDRGDRGDRVRGRLLPADHVRDRPSASVSPTARSSAPTRSR